MSHGVTEDYYATLGVEPRSEAAVVRAAYLALMRLYHPDKNDSPAAIDRARAIIAAFAVLGDSEKRLHYDWGRRRAAEAAAQPPPSRLSKLPRAPIAAALSLLLLVPFVMIQSPRTVRDPLVGPTASGADPGTVPNQSSKRDAATPPLAAPPPITAKPDAVEPVPIEPQAAAQPRTRGDEVTHAPALAPRVPPAPRERRQARKDVTTKTAPADASARCRLVKPGAEAAICNNGNLTALDRNVVEFYNQSLQFGAATKRGALLDSRNGFLARREECRTDACLQSLHLTHLRELSAIVENRPPNPAQ